MENLPTTGNGAEAFIATLNSLGVDRIFFNPGIDQVPLMAAVAQYRATGEKAPQIILCTDESVAVSAAHGYAMVSGKPQLVAVFEDVGTLQGGGAIVNLQYGRVPVIICAGTNTQPNRLNWRKEPFDQRRSIRDYMKWDHAVSVQEDISSVLRQAYRIAAAEPCGPVYLTLPRELLTGTNGQAPVTPDPTWPTPTPVDDLQMIEAAADLLLDAVQPLILTAYAGRHPECVAQLVELAETLAVRVVTTDLRMNFPSTHPLCPGMDCIKGDCYDHYIAEADVVFLIDYSFPGPMGKRFAPDPTARIIHIDRELLKDGRPLWDRTPDIALQGDSSELLPRLTRTIKERLQPGHQARIDRRAEQITGEHRKIKEQFRILALEERARRPISMEWLCHCINEALDAEAVVVHQTPSNADAMSRHIRRTRPGTLFTWGDHAGSMGWALPAALGARMALPDQLVVSIIGDGGFIYGCPVATLWGAAAHQAPFLTIILNNRSYAVFRQVMGMFYGNEMQRRITEDSALELGIGIMNPPDFATIARGCHAHGRRVSDPAEVPAALQEAIEQVRGGTSAVLDIIIG